jgi:hypothetical protein
VKKLEFMTEAELRALMKVVCCGIEASAEVCGVEQPHFVVVLFNDPAVAQYASNCDRASIIKAMRETADRLERNQDVPR